MGGNFCTEKLASLGLPFTVAGEDHVGLVQLGAHPGRGTGGGGRLPRPRRKERRRKRKSNVK